MPLCVYYLPNKIAFILFENDDKMRETYYKTLFSSYSILPILNPLSALLMVHSYRNALINHIKHPFYIISEFSEISMISLVKKWNKSSTVVSTTKESQLV